MERRMCPRSPLRLGTDDCQVVIRAVSPIDTPAPHCSPASDYGMLLLLEHSLLGRFTDILSDGCQDGLRLFFKTGPCFVFQWPDLLNILRQSYDYLMIMP